MGCDRKIFPAGIRGCWIVGRLEDQLGARTGQAGAELDRWAGGAPGPSFVSRGGQHGTPFVDLSEHEEQIRLLIFNLTTFGRIEDERCTSGETQGGLHECQLTASLHPPSCHHPVARQPRFAHLRRRCSRHCRSKAVGLSQRSKRARYRDVCPAHFPPASDHS